MEIAIGCGHTHSEWAWADRIPSAFRFLYNPWDEPNELLEEGEPQPQPGSVQFTASSVSVDETAGTVRVTVSRTGGAEGAASVSYATSNGTATAGSDYTAASGTLTWADQDSAQKYVDVAILDDAVYEGNETFYVNLSNATGANLGSPARITVTILDNEPPPPQLVITNPLSNISVGSEMNAYTLQGTVVAENWQGLTWSNSLTAGSGAIPFAANWSAPNVPLGAGANVITVTATNTGDALTLVASDSAADDAYGDLGEWANESNGGFGFEPWSLAANGNAGHFTYTNGWGFWSQVDDLSEAIRPFPQPLEAGARFEATIKNKWIMEDQQGVGIALRNSDGDSLIQYYFNGGDDEYQIEDADDGRDSGIGWTEEPQHLQFDILSATNYSLTVGSVTINGAFSGTISQVRFWSYSGGVGEDYNFFCNDLNLYEAGGGLVSTSATVTITREAGGAPAEPVISDIQLQGGGAGGLNLSIPDSQIGLNYAIWASPTLFPSSNWQKVIGSTKPGTGEAIDLPIDDSGMPINFYRIGYELE